MFRTHWRHCGCRKQFILCRVLVQPRKTGKRPFGKSVELKKCVLIINAILFLIHFYLVSQNGTFKNGVEPCVECCYIHGYTLIAIY